MNVSKEEFEKFKGEAISLGKCKMCIGNGGTIKIMMPWYGQTGVAVTCARCGHRTGIHRISYEVSCPDTKTYGTFVSEESLMCGIREAVKEWNGGAEGER